MSKSAPTAPGTKTAPALPAGPGTGVATPERPGLKTKIVQSGIIHTVLSFVTGGCNFYFPRILSSALDGANSEYGAFKTTAVFVTLLGLPLSMATQAVIHHIAHYQGTGNKAQLNGLLAGCRSFLL